MLNSQKKNPDTDDLYYEGSFPEPFIKKLNRKLSQWTGLKKGLTETLRCLLYFPKKIDRIPFRKINRILNRLAVKGIPKDDLKKGKIIISLSKKPSLEWVSPFKKKLIERTINELKGFDNLKLNQYYSFKPLYIEKKMNNKISRWIEIEITKLD